MNRRLGQHARADQTRQIVREMYLAGRPISEIVGATGLSHGTINYHRKAMRLPRRVGFAKDAMSKLSRYDLIVWRLSGGTSADLAAQIGVKKETIRSAMWRAEAHARRLAKSTTSV